MAKPKKRLTKTVTSKRPRRVIIEMAHMGALNECANALEDMLNGPLTPELIEAAQEALDTLEIYDEEEPEEEDDEPRRSSASP